MLRMLALLTPDLRFKIKFAAQFYIIVKPLAHHCITAPPFGANIF